MRSSGQITRRPHTLTDLGRQKSRGRFVLRPDELSTHPLPSPRTSAHRPRISTKGWRRHNPCGSKSRHRHVTSTSGKRRSREAASRLQTTGKSLNGWRLRPPHSRRRPRRRTPRRALRQVSRPTPTSSNPRLPPRRQAISPTSSPPSRRTRPSPRNSTAPTRSPHRSSTPCSRPLSTTPPADPASARWRGARR